MTRRATPKPGVDRMVSTSWSGRRWSSPAARQGRALARGLEGRLPLQHHYVRDQNSSSSRCRAYFSLALKHGIDRDRTDGHRGRWEISSYSSLREVNAGRRSGQGHVQRQIVVEVETSVTRGQRFVYVLTQAASWRCARTDISLRRMQVTGARAQVDSLACCTSNFHALGAKCR